jgi:hypothetical protein
MSGVETVSAPCPNCDKAMYQKYESNLSGFMFDACFSCGYASGECNRVAWTAREIWETILAHFSFQSIAEFAANTDWLRDCKVGADPNFQVPIFVPDENLSLCIVDINFILVETSGEPVNT